MADFRSTNLSCVIAFVFLTLANCCNAQIAFGQQTPYESPVAREIRANLKVNPGFGASDNLKPRTSRAIYELRNRINNRKGQTTQERKSNAQTLDQLLEEIDKLPPATSDGRSFNPRTANPQDNLAPALVEPTPPTAPIGNQTGSQPQPISNAQLNPQGFAASDGDQVLNNLNAVDPFLNSALERFERMAIENHPTLNKAVAQVAAARQEAIQAGLHPNPRLGVFIDEAGNDNDPGLWGAFLQRQHIRGNKLAIGQQIKNREAIVLESKFETQVIKLRTDVRTAFYKLLIAREKFILASQLYRAQQDAIQKSAELFEAGETPKTDLLQTELQSQKTLILLSQIEIAQANAWRELAAVVGRPELPFQNVSGDLNPASVQVTFEECLSHILTASPEIRTAQAEMDRVRSTIDREVAKTIPNYQTQLTVGRDSNTNHFFTGLQVQVPLQITDQNQGNIAAAKSRLVVAQNELERIKLDLSKRLSTEYQQYKSALVKTEMFTNRLLPKAKQTLDLLSAGYPQEVSFLQLLTAQQTVIEITLEYLDTLNLVWQSRLKIEGLLLNDSLSR